MTAFDQAWNLVKMPYHGTLSDRLPSIMREGLRPHSAEESRYSDERDTKHNYGGKDRVFSTMNRNEALAFAALALADQKSKTDRVSGGKTRYTEDDPYPVVLHFPDELAERARIKGRLSRDWRTSDETIPPDVIDVDFEGKVDVSDNPLWYTLYSRLKDKMRDSQ